MIKAVINTQNYFQAPRDYFWRWSDKMEVLEWKSGRTICYRDDLTGILRELSLEGFPPLAPLLMILAACQGKLHVQDNFSLLKIKDAFGEDSLEPLVASAVKFLNNISALPSELRTGRNRIQLIHEVFQAAGFVFSNTRLKEAVDELESGRLNTILSEEGEPITKEQFVTHLNYLAGALKRFPSTKRLELRLRTGLNKLPDAAPIVPPEPLPGDLFEQLADDPRTQGIVRLADRLVAVLNIPMHSQASGDLSYGGLSDITNRGNYDRLLLSELAHDDLLLMARLVNNEALYFRREEPPDNPKRKRTLLLDTTLKMWGIPRVFAMAAALAFARNSRHGELIEAYALGGENYTAVNLASREGVIRALEQLHHALHCGSSLQAIIHDLPASDQDEYILITDARQLVYPAFHACLQKVKESLQFVITIDRKGDLQFFACHKGRMKLLNAARLELNELLFAPRTVSKTAAKEIAGPAFLSQSPAPLLFPKTRIKQLPERLFIIDGVSIVLVNEAQRVLLLTGSHTGARELLPFIEKGAYTFGSAGDQLYILANNRQRKFLKLYKISLVTFLHESFNLSDEVQFANKASFSGSELYVRTDYASFIVDCDKAEIIETKDYKSFAGKIDVAVADTNKQLERLNGYFVRSNPSYNVMSKVREMYIDEEERLVIGRYTLRLVEGDRQIRVKENLTRAKGSRQAKEVQIVSRLLSGKNIKFSKRAWGDCSTAIIDSRGLLHLKSSDPRLPEITIVLVTGMNTACWASDGSVTGPPYFTGEERPEYIPAKTFYETYIQPFIDRLKDNEPVPAT